MEVIGYADIPKKKVQRTGKRMVKALRQEVFCMDLPFRSKSMKGPEKDASPERNPDKGITFGWDGREIPGTEWGWLGLREK